MFNVLIFIIGAGIMFYMGLRSVLQRRRLQQKGQRVEARVAGTVQSRDGAAYLLEFETEGGSHRLHYPKASKGKGFASGETVRPKPLPRAAPSPCITTRRTRRRCMWRATAPFWGPRSSISVWPLCCWH